jgi:hypothetical protein
LLLLAAVIAAVGCCLLLAVDAAVVSISSHLTPSCKTQIV